MRYSYHLQATAQFALPKQLPNLPRIPLSSSAAVLADFLDPERGPFGSVVLPPSGGASNDGVPPHPVVIASCLCLSSDNGNLVKVPIKPAAVADNPANLSSSEGK